MPEKLVTVGRACVMVRVSLQVEQKIVGDPVARVPGMQGCDLFVPPVLQFSTFHSVMLQVVHHLQKRNRDQALHKEKEHGTKAKGPGQTRNQNDLQCQVSENGVLQAPDSLSFPFQAFGFDLPCAPKPVCHGPRPECVKGLSQTSRGRIQGCGHIPVMSLYVFNGPVHVSHGREHHPSEHRFEPVVDSVDEFVRHIDSQSTTCDSHREDETRKLDEAHGPMSNHIGGPDYECHLERCTEPGNGTKAAIFGQPFRLLLSGVPDVHTEQHIQKGNQAEYKKQGKKVVSSSQPVAYPHGKGQKKDDEKGVGSHGDPP